MPTTASRHPWATVPETLVSYLDSVNGTLVPEKRNLTTEPYTLTSYVQLTDSMKDEYR